ncbi:MAG: hypothetical protein ACRD3H_19610 [Terriglobales bacterium]|nr:hypothetical protein [Terriglobales bacterium]
MSLSRARAVACWIMILVVPFSLWAADSGPAMLYARGAAWINGGSVPRTSAVFPGDLVQTRYDSMANINASGSNIVVLADSLVKFDGPEISLEHGAVTVTTSKGMTTHAGEVTVVPVSSGWTEFDVKQGADGAVQVVARKGDLSVSDGTDTSTVSQGQQTTVDDSQAKKKKKRRKGGGAIPAGESSVLSSPILLYGGAAAVGGLVTWVLLQGNTPASATTP